MTDLAGQVVFITGGSSGIGREAALAFARRSCRVALGARRVKLLQDLKEEISRRHPGLESLA
ncbi:MAG TPA: SDR family NAD(P)-dependent oxidoreductase, partial [Anaerolineales bacterium]|nr:SDR family NAD(P)-dependent oxidoreductase [Anaerolineales bacterium]